MDSVRGEPPGARETTGARYRKKHFVLGLGSWFTMVLENVN